MQTSGIESNKFGMDGLLLADAGRMFFGLTLSITGIYPKWLITYKYILQI